MQLVSRKTLVLFSLPAALFMGFFLIYPIVRMAVVSLLHVDTGGIFFIGFENYKQAFLTSSFLVPLGNTIKYVIIAVSIELAFGLIFALILENKFRGSRIIRSLFLTPLMIAPLVAGLIWRLMFSGQFGIINQILINLHFLKNSSDILWLADERIALIACCIADIWLTTPFMMLMILAGLQTIDTDMLEAARIDGAGILRQIISIKLPIIKPILLTALSIRVIDAARTFDIIWAMTQGGPNRSSEVIGIVIYKTLARYNKPGYASAMAMVFIIVLMVFTLVFMQSLWRTKNNRKGEDG
jgi:multiple sugar transport system permease protein